jgi:hypothetical protein
MIDLRIVADDHGYMQLQSRGFCVQRGWTEWKSVPIVHDPSQLVDRIEVFDAKTSGAKPDGGLTAAQVVKILRAFENARQRHQLECLGSGDVNYVSSQVGMAAGIDDCLSVIRSELNPQPDEPSVEQDEADHPF